MFVLRSAPRRHSHPLIGNSGISVLIFPDFMPHTCSPENMKISVNWIAPPIRNKSEFQVEGLDYFYIIQSLLKENEKNNCSTNFAYQFIIRL